jgi:hypothetical protein
VWVTFSPLLKKQQIFFIKKVGAKLIQKLYNQKMKTPNIIKNFLKIAVKWLPFAVIITFLTGFIFLSNQQNLRISANDPQIQLAEDYAAYLKEGNYPDDLSQFQKVNINESLSTFVIIMDDSGKIIGSSANLDDKSPTPPQGTLDFAKKHGQNRFTWEPKKGVRSAVVLARIDGPKPGFVLVGRSLREIDKRVKTLMIQTVAVYVATLLVTYIVIALTVFLSNKRKAKLSSKVIETDKVAEEIINTENSPKLVNVSNKSLTNTQKKLEDVIKTNEVVESSKSKKRKKNKSK